MFTLEDEDMHEPLWTTAEAARFLGTTEECLRVSRVKCQGWGLLPYVKINHSVRYVPRMLRRALSEHVHVKQRRKQNAESSAA